eukprot:IDg5134t1
MLIGRLEKQKQLQSLQQLNHDYCEFCLAIITQFNMQQAGSLDLQGESNEDGDATDEDLAGTLALNEAADANEQFPTELLSLPQSAPQRHSTAREASTYAENATNEAYHPDQA